jgi:hypothetical protein
MAFTVIANQSTGFSIEWPFTPLSEFSDNFNDNSLDTTKWLEWETGNSVETGGRMQIQSTTAASYRGMESKTTGSLIGSYVQVEVPHVLTGLTSASTDLQLAIDGDHTITMYESGGQLYAEHQLNGNWVTVASIPYNATNHRWWRIREASGTIYYEYSANGITWSQLASAANPFTLTALFVMLFIGTNAANASTDTAIFDNLNTFPLLSSSKAQYRNDLVTPIAVGGATEGDGVANNVWLDAEVSVDMPASAVTMEAEVRTVGTGFTNVATVTATPRIFKQTELINSRRGSCMVYDAKNKRFIVFGGYNGSIRFNETWELSADSPYHRWKKLTPSGTPPTAKNLAASTYARGTTSGSVDKAYMVVWGGAIPGDTNEMHVLDVSVPGSEAWTTISQTSAPAARSYITHHMVAKVTASNTIDIYLFGGWGATRLNDLQRCTFNVNSPGSVTWTALKANGAVGSPSARSGTAMIYDSANNRLVITCGRSDSAYLNDLWQYNIATNTFSQISPGGTAPAIRELPSIGYDAVNQRAILVAGWQGNITSNRNDVFSLSLTPVSESWTEIRSNSLTNQGILAFSNASSAVDTSRNLMVMSTINGYDATDKYAYAFDMNDTSPSAPLGSLNVADHFRARDAPSVAYDSSRNEMVFINGYGAMDDDETIGDGEHVAEIWAYDHTNNKWRSAMGGPVGMPQSEGGLSVYDSVNDRIIHFGGLAGTNQMNSDVWELKADDYGVYHARKLAPSGTIPPQRWQAAGCYDVTNQRMIVWGGQNQSTILNDVWALNLTLGSEAWTQLSPTGSAPTPVWQSAYAYDSASKRLYVHGGYTGAGYSSQLFYLDITTTNGAWTNTNVTGGTGVRGAVMGYDSTNQRLVCFGGYDGSAVNNTVRYTSTSSFTSWTTQATSNTPPARRSAGASVIGDVFVVSCGRPVSGTWFSDTHELNFKESPAAWIWTNKSPDIYQRLTVGSIGLTLGASYHWQSWATISGASSAPSPFGGNAESAADFIVGGVSGGKIKIYDGSGWVAKPVKVWDGSGWVQKPVKRWDGSSWQETSY